MNTYAIPGVFMEEISRPPSAVAEVATAIPAFIGYTQITNKDAAGIHPVRIASLAEYETVFGKADKTIMLDVSINDVMEGDILTDRTIAATAYGSTPNTMYYHMQLYFANGGGPCYIVSVGKANKVLFGTDLLAGLDAIGRFDEPSLLVFPEGVHLSIVNTPEVLAAQAAVEEAKENGTAQELEAAYDNLAKANTKSKARSLHYVYDAALLQCARLKNRFVIMDCMDDDPEMLRNSEYGIGSDNLQYGAAYHPFLETAINYVYDDASFTVWHVINGDVDTYFSGTSSYDPDQHEELLHIARQKAAGLHIKLNPCSAIAAVYAYADRTRGVWKAPANIRLNLVHKPTKLVADDEQESLDADTATHKPINTICSIAGKGTLVQGARTLADNDSKWRSVAVSRFCSMVEESIKRSVAAFVSEENDINTRVKVQRMIEGYLLTHWRAGALRGSKPEQAFYVSVGSGNAMTAQHVYLEIGMAVIRPSAFIVLRLAV